MAMKVNKEIHLYGGTNKTPPPDTEHTVLCHPDKMPGPRMRCEAIEAEKTDDKTGIKGKNDLGDNEGNLCIGVQPGEEVLGEYYLSIQFEGPSGKRKICMNGQNELLRDTSADLAKIMDALGFTAEVTIDAEPCPAPEAPPLQVIEAAQNLEQVPVKIDQKVPVTVDVRNENKL